MKKLMLSLLLVGLTVVASTDVGLVHPNGPGFVGPPVHGVKAVEMVEGMWF